MNAPHLSVCLFVGQSILPSTFFHDKISSIAVPGSEWDRFEASMQEDVWESFSLMADIRNLFGPLSIM